MPLLSQVLQATGTALRRINQDFLRRNQEHSISNEVISVCVSGELLNIPYRVYYGKRQLLTAVDCPGEAGLIALCLGTRHHDGFIREQCVRRLLAIDDYWTAPFIVQLLGEYVIEVVQPIHERFIERVDTKYIDFFVHNAKYCQYLECRAISYWNEYYRWRFPKHKDYPALKALAALAGAAKRVEKQAVDACERALAATNPLRVSLAEDIDLL